MLARIKSMALLGGFHLLAPVCAWAAAESPGGQPNLFAGTPGNILVTALIFGVVVLVLGKFAWPPLMRVLEERELTIRESLEDAKRERAEAAVLLRQYTEQIERAKVEAAEIIENGRRKAADIGRRLQDDARKEAQATVDRGVREIQLAAEAAKREVYDMAAQLAVDVAGRIIHKQLSVEDHEKLVAESLEIMRRSGANMN